MFHIFSNSFCQFFNIVSLYFFSCGVLRLELGDSSISKPDIMDMERFIKLRKDFMLCGNTIPILLALSLHNTPSIIHSIRGLSIISKDRVFYSHFIVPCCSRMVEMLTKIEM